MELRRAMLLSVTFVLFIDSLIECIEVDFTVDVGPGKQECFYEEFKKATSLDVEYQVIDGGDLDINFSVQGPGGQLLIADVRKHDTIHKVDVKVPGAYAFCFDNSFSRISRKVVFFELMTDDDEDDTDNWNPDKEELADLMDMTMDDFKVLIENVRINLDKSAQLQTVIRTHEARDRNIQENNFDLVNTFSCIQLAVMIVVGFVQVVMIRSLFDDKSKISKVLKQRT